MPLNKNIFDWWWSNFHNTPENNNLQNLFKTKCNFTASRNRDRYLDNQIDILNNLDLEGMDRCSKKSLSKMEPSELSKLFNKRTIIIKTTDKGGAATIHGFRDSVPVRKLHACC